MTTFSRYSAIARTTKFENWVHVAAYSGFFSKQAWVCISKEVEKERENAIVIIDKIYSSVMDLNNFTKSQSIKNLTGSPIGIWVVSQDQEEYALRLSRQLADFGISRLVFLQAYEDLALDVALSLVPVSR